MEVLKLIASILITASVVAGLFVLQKKTPYGKINKYLRQIIDGVVFGGVAIICTHLAFELDGASVNARDGAIISAGLLFGPFAGIIAGVIGGVERYFATVIWGIGEYTQVACTISAIVSGLLSALASRFLFKSERPSFIYAFAVGVIAEVFHMLMVFFVHTDDLGTASNVVESCALWIILASSTSAALSALVVSLIDKKKPFSVKKIGELSYAFQLRLLAIVAVSLVITTVFGFFIQTGIARKDAEEALQESIVSIGTDIEHGGDALEHSSIWTVWTDGGVIACDSSGTILTGYHYGESVDSVVDVPSSAHELKPFYADVDGVYSYCMYETINSGAVTAAPTAEDVAFLVAYIPNAEVMYYRDVAFWITLFIEVLIFGAVFVSVYLMTDKLVVKNIGKVNSALAKITDGDLDEKVDVNGFREFETLSDDINKTVDTLKRYIAKESARIDAELAFAKAVQHSALPSVFPPFPTRHDIDIFATMDTAKEVGGDFYDFYFVGSNKLAFLVADVSDKGIPAAMFMMTAKTVIKSLAESGLSPDAVMERANSKLCENNSAGMFVTAWLGIIDLCNGKVEFCSAGHNPPVLVKSGKTNYMRSKPGLVLGAMDGVKYRCDEITLSPYDRIVLYTDGITEAANPENELFGETRLLESVDNRRGDRARDLTAEIKSDVEDFASGASQSDDMTMLVFDYFGKQENSITVDANADGIAAIGDFVDKALEKDASKDDLSKIHVIVDEIAANIVRYAYDDAGGFISVGVSFEKRKREVKLDFVDAGVSYDPLTAEEPDTSLSVEEREPGGLGIFLVKKLTDRLDYSRRSGRNVLTAVKRLSPKTGVKRGKK